MKAAVLLGSRKHSVVECMHGNGSCCKNNLPIHNGLYLESEWETLFSSRFADLQECGGYIRPKLFLLEEDITKCHLLLISLLGVAGNRYGWTVLYTAIPPPSIMRVILKPFLYESKTLSVGKDHQLVCHDAAGRWLGDVRELSPLLTGYIHRDINTPDGGTTARHR